LTDIPINQNNIILTQLQNIINLDYNDQSVVLASPVLERLLSFSRQFAPIGLRLFVDGSDYVDGAGSRLETNGFVLDSKVSDWETLRPNV
jgi:hypothetical protein